MSDLPSSSPASLRSTSSSHNSFHDFFEWWLVEQKQELDELISASKQKLNNKNNNHDSLQPLINRVLEHYEQYYSAKSKWAKHDVLAMFSPSWTSPLEDAFLWIGGWRPSMAFHLLYSKSGLQLEAQLHDVIRGLCTGDLGDLSPNQLVQVDEFQRRIIREEKNITEKMAKHQATVADTSMVELTHAISKTRRDEGSSIGNEVQERVESTLKTKLEGLEKVLQKADDLRLRTLKGIIDILTPDQTVHFLIAAAELHLRLHELGKKMDTKVIN
ncbi:protein DOG1-like 4 [Ricinus communis]|uniref:protein DOG1-like 4 n=1 Tax=Ricinus communis TaxID=3988 RepID=UPI00201B2E20|nr:protein DOG1-like 4 [Ricinus communis]